jgi:hypothetical protein
VKTPKSKVWKSPSGMVVDQLGTMPRWARGLAERQCARRHVRITFRWMKCSRGCPHGRAFTWRHHIRCYTSGHATSDKYLLIHEMAHIFDPLSRGHTATFYRAAIEVARDEGCLRGWLKWQGRMAQAEYRRMRRETCPHRAVGGEDPAICQDCGRAVA